MFWHLHRPFVLSNKKFKDLHSGETCFIFANGASLKNYNISAIPQHPIIGCSYALIDTRLQKLNVKYMVSTDSYLFYPYLFNTYPHVKKFQKNKIRALFSEMISRNTDVTFFVNLTNIYSAICRKSNVSYFYHFGDRNSGSHNLAGNFAEMGGALDIMLGVAKYMGFSKAVLIGCDYLGSPPVMGHFYADSKPFEGQYMEEYCDRVKIAAHGIDVLVILPSGVSSPDFTYASYEEYFSLEKKYTSNHEFIDTRHLELLRDAEKSNQAIMVE